LVNERSTSAHALREKAISEFHDLLAADQTLSPVVFKKLRSAMRKKRLLYGERPIGVALRPHLLHHEQFRALTRLAERVTSALEKVAAAVVQDPKLMEELGLTEAERKMALVDPGFSTAGVTTRLDAFVHGDEIKFVESNAENPSSLPDQEELNRLLFELPAMASFARRYSLGQFSPVKRLLETLLITYREWGGSGVPNIAILDWKELPTSSEFVFLQEHFSAHGVPTIICSPDDLEYQQGQLRCGAFRIDLVYKRVIIHEFLARYDDAHPLIRAYVNHDVCLVNPFRCKIMHKKAVFEMLTDDHRQDWFTSSEKEAIRRTVPWTRRVFDRKTTRHGQMINLLEFISRNRSTFVLKPNDDYGGHGVCFGSQLDEREWQSAIEKALLADYIVQDALDLHPEVFPIFSETDWKLQPMFVDTNPFLFRGKVCGAMVRLSATPIVNVTSGGGETGFFILQ
jgi:glutathionylspermidine synthase